MNALALPAADARPHQRAVLLERWPQGSTLPDLGIAVCLSRDPVCDHGLRAHVLLLLAPLGLDPLGLDPLGFEPLRLDPLGFKPLGFNPLGLEPLGLEPLGFKTMTLPQFRN